MHSQPQQQATQDVQIKRITAPYLKGTSERVQKLLKPLNI